MLGLKIGTWQAEPVTDSAIQHRQFAQGLRAKIQSTTDKNTRAELERVARQHERVAANLERGWPAES